MLRTKQYTKDQRIFMVNHKSRGDSYKCINYDFKRAFPLSGRDPNNMTIWRQKKKFDTEGIQEFYSTIVEIYHTGTVHNLNTGRSGRKPSALTDQKLQMVEDLLEGLHFSQNTFIFWNTFF